MYEWKQCWQDEMKCHKWNIYEWIKKYKRDGGSEEKRTDSLTSIPTLFPFVLCHLIQ